MAEYQSLPPEIQLQILQNLPPLSIYNFYLGSRPSNDAHYILNEVRNGRLLISSDEKLEILDRAIFDNEPVIINLLLLLLFKSNWSWNRLLAEAAKKNYINIISYAIDHDANNFDQALFNSAEREHYNLIVFFISKGADIHWGLFGAAKGGHLDLVKYFISQDPMSLLDFALYHAAKGGYIHIVEYLTSQGAAISDKILEGAILGQHLNMVEYLVSRGTINLNRALIIAMKTKNKDIIDYLISQGARL